MATKRLKPRSEKTSSRLDADLATLAAPPVEPDAPPPLKPKAEDVYKLAAETGCAYIIITADTADNPPWFAVGGYSFLGAMAVLERVRNQIAAMQNKFWDDQIAQQKKQEKTDA